VRLLSGISRNLDQAKRLVLTLNRQGIIPLVKMSDPDRC
jgi:hypothetical protein